MEQVEALISNVFFLTWIGALCGHILSLYSPDFNGTVPFLSKIFPEKSETFYARLDFIVLPIIGATLAFVLLEPQGLKSSIFAGISWSGTLIALLKRNSNKINNTDND